MECHGVKIEKGISDWQVLQQQDGAATAALSGIWELPQAEVGQECTVVVRLLREDDNAQVLPWQSAANEKTTEKTGIWHINISIPAGGPYRLETGMDIGRDAGKIWVLRGDLRLHICVGNVFVIAGQSNAAGYGRSNAYDPSQLGVHTYRNCGRWDLAAHPLNETTDCWSAPNAENSNCGTSPYIAFGKMLQRISGLPVGLVPTALGGSPIRRWVKGLQGDLYENMLQCIQSAGVHVAGILWYQGCSDTDTQQQAEGYLDNFTKIVNDLRADLKYCVPFFTYQLNRHTASTSPVRWSVVKEAQRKAAHDIDRVYILPTLDCTMSDEIHNSSAANTLLGERLARQAGIFFAAQASGLRLTFSRRQAAKQHSRLAFRTSRLGLKHLICRLLLGLWGRTKRAA